jgi:hypothetical protein
MERQNINSYVHIEDMTHHVRPSVLDKIKSTIHGANIWYFKDLCSVSEDKLRQYPYLTDKIVNDIKNYLGNYGLKLGMTDEELVEYQDAEFLEKHPFVCVSDETGEEIYIEGVLNAEYNETNDVMFDSELNHSIAEKTKEQGTASDSEPMAEHKAEKKSFAPFKEMRRAYADSMYDPTKNMPIDGECILHQIRLCMLREQPWFIKWLVLYNHQYCFY